MDTTGQALKSHEALGMPGDGPIGRFADYAMYAAATTPLLSMSVYGMATLLSANRQAPVWAVWVVFGSAVVAVTCLMAGLAIVAFQQLFVATIPETQLAKFSDTGRTARVAATAAEMVNNDNRRAGDIQTDRATATNIAYGDIPWFRQSRTMTGFILVGFFCIPPLLWAACVICLSGDVYFRRLKKDGTLARWSPANKIAAVAILLLQAIGVAVRMDAFK